MPMNQEAVEKNIYAIRDHAVETRKQQSDTKQEVSQLKAMVVAQGQQLEALQGQVGMLLAQVNGGRATSGH